MLLFDFKSPVTTFLTVNRCTVHVTNECMHHLRLAGKGQSKDGKITQKILWPPVIQIVDPRSFCYSWQCIKKYLFCKERKDKKMSMQS